MGTVLKSREAARDILKQYFWIAARSEETADRFLAALEATFARAVRMPGIGAPVDSPPGIPPGLRCLTVDGFRNHVIFYRPIENGIEVVRVVRGTSDLAARLQEPE